MNNHSFTQSSSDLQEKNTNIVSVINGQAFTTSLDIAEGTGNEHASVIKLIRQNIKDFEEFGSLGFEIQVGRTDGRGGQQREVAILNEQQATLLMTYFRNNEIVKTFKKNLVKAFFQMAKLLQQKSTQPKELSRKDILRLALEVEAENEMLKADNQQIQEENEWYEQQHEKMEQKLVSVMPKVAFADAVSVKSGSIGVRQAAKILGTGQNRLMEFLRDIAWVDKHNEPYQTRIEAGYLDSKITDWQHPEKGLKRSITTLVKPKGLHKLQQLLDERMAIHQKIIEHSNDLLKI